MTIHTFYLLVGIWLFLLGSVIGSFLNVCIYRIPWQKSVIWPSSHCPRCLHPIAARDNIPIVSWFALRGECRQCGLPIAARYAMVEALVGLLFVGVFLTDVVFNPMGLYGASAFVRMAYHQLLVTFLVAATFIDYDLQIIPDEITLPGMVLGLGIGVLVPWVRPEPGMASTWSAGFWTGAEGLLVGGGVVWIFRFVFTHALGREAMGFGDVTLMGLIGAFLGWQAALLCFFIAPFFGLAHAAWKIVLYVQKRLRGAELSSADRELPFGPYLSMAAVTLMLSWPWFWEGWARGFFETLTSVVLFLLGRDPAL